MDIENEKITIEKDGHEVECDVLFTFTLDETGKVYIGFTDHSKDNEGNEVLYVKSYDPVFGTVQDLNAQEIEVVNSMLKDIERR
ncbi:MAG: DUF1292 domain-containing protein [Bacilli bacterium]|nr:DUF1292 domain-containing protein [Bacilli bacterium]